MIQSRLIMSQNFVLLVVLTLVLSSCGQQDPSGRYTGQMMDWVHEVFDGVLITQGKECEISLELSQASQDMRAVLIFRHPDLQETRREGEWSIGDGERVINFNDGKTPDEYYLIKRGVRYAFQTRSGISNDDGSPVLLVRNDGKSRKASYPLEMLLVRREGFMSAGWAVLANAQVNGSGTGTVWLFRSNYRMGKIRPAKSFLLKPINTFFSGPKMQLINWSWKNSW